MYKYSSNLVLKQVRKARRKINKKLCLGGKKKKRVRDAAAAVFLMQ